MREETGKGVAPITFLRHETQNLFFFVLFFLVFQVLRCIFVRCAPDGKKGKFRTQLEGTAQRRV